MPPPPPGPPGTFRSSARVAPPDGRPGGESPEGPQGIRPPSGYAGSVGVPPAPGGPQAGPHGRISGPLNSGRPLGAVNRPGNAGGPPTATWSAGPPDADQNRFEAFRPDADATATTPAATDDKPEPPAKERNGRVLAMVLGAAVLLLVIPLAVVYLFTRSSGDGFNPAVGECVRRSGDTAISASCAEPDAFQVVSRVDDAAQCPDKGQPIVEVSGGRADNVLCLTPKAAAPAGSGDPSATPTN
ncbi:hypothetical protein [Asanoa sp. NPDC050611]|uniref:LppU/SCO3897 family protein n=1 Tax=Asanoa sp. NPDC050611 TaxID=3157098 RepID=UPI0033FB5BAB